MTISGVPQTADKSGRYTGSILDGSISEDSMSAQGGASKFVYDFHEGNRDMKDLLGGKGANLAEMTNIGLPVPPGFTITTEACLSYLEEDRFPAGLMDECDGYLRRLAEA